MKAHFEKIPHRWTHTYEIKAGNKILFTYSKRKFIPIPRVAEIKEEGNVLAVIKEKNPLLHFAKKLPIIGIILLRLPYEYSFTILSSNTVGNCLSYRSRKNASFIIDYNGSTFELYFSIYKGHKRYYVFKDGIQIGAIEESNSGRNGVFPSKAMIEGLSKTEIATILSLIKINQLSDFSFSFQISTSKRQFLSVYKSPFEDKIKHINI